jgi:tetratricopeptide (TPR) repeat protein
LRGRFLFENGDWAGAAEAFGRALAVRPDYKEALRGAADCARRLGNEDEAHRWDERLLLFVELTDSVYAGSAKAAPRKRAALEQLVADYPAWGEGFLELAELQQGAGEHKAACRTIESYLAAHGAEVPAGQQESLRQRFCGKGP